MFQIALARRNLQWSVRVKRILTSVRSDLNPATDCVQARILRHRAFAAETMRPDDR